MKKCTACKQDKKLSEFYFIKSAGYYSSHCIECEKQKSKDRKYDGDAWMGLVCGDDEWVNTFFENKNQVK
jgi:hypothetical protein